MRYAQLGDPTRPGDPTQPGELPDDSRATGGEAAHEQPPPDRDGPHHSTDLLALTGDHPADHHLADDPAPGSTAPAPDAELDAELASFAALRWADPPGPTAAPDSAAPNSEEIR